MTNVALSIPRGFGFFGKNIGIKDNSKDLGGILSDCPCTAAAVFTRNTLPGAPIIVGRKNIADGKLQAIIVNSKNANVATEQKGIEDCETICEILAGECGIDKALVLPSSTGVIGKRLPMDIIRRGCEGLKNIFQKDEQSLRDFAASIMTTDTRPKIISAKVGNASIVGIAKGAGMIEPNMATMLAYFVTDAGITSENLQTILSRCVNKSFNRISIDTDTSTSDTVAILANGLAGEVDEKEFESTLAAMSIYLAKEIARDGEGASKLIELTVTGAETAEQALLTAKACVNSPLVKTAIYGADPNWGRFVMAIGKVFQYQVDISKVTIWFGRNDERLGINSRLLDAEKVRLQDISALLKREEIFIEVELGAGKYSETVWGCDLTEGYVEVNAHYTT